jgi:hypothetical protein
MTTKSDDIAGLPIKGDRSWYTTRDNGPQLGPEEFVAQIKDIFSTGEVGTILWRQHTPYFNDGEACVFYTGEIYFYPVPSLDPNYDPDGESEFWDEVYRGMKAIETYSYRGSQETRVSAETLAKVKAFSLNPFQNVCLEYFGDPAEVTATPEGFEVEYYEHD